MTKTVADMVAPPPRSVRPRTRTHKHLPVIAIARDEFLTEDGEVGTIKELVDTLPDRDPTLFAKLSAADFVAGDLSSVYILRDPDHWQWRAATHERDIVRPDGARIAKMVSTIIPYFGFKGGNYHKIIDPVAMYGHKLDEIIPGDDPAVIKLLRWAVTLRDFCSENNIEVRPTIGGISSQLLTDPRFYPNARRKVPAATNERVRQMMPGNYYVLNVHPTPNNNFAAYYLDQTRAHHHHAQQITFPSSNTLYAHGRFTDLARPVLDDVWPDFYGLYCLDLKPPENRSPFHWLPRKDRPLLALFVFSNELPHLLDMGYTVTGVRAAWGSRHADTGLGKYAAWATTQLDHFGDPAWLKPLLLSAYGVLATRPRHAEAVFRLVSQGEPVTLRTGHHKLNGRRTRAPRKLEPGIANVLHRGMIEAATRSESVGLAQWLDHLGHRVLSIYADAVIVQADDDKPLPSLPEPWRSKQTLNHLQFINQQAFVSDGMTKLPGVGRELRDYRQHRKPGHAPRVVQYEALTGNQVQTDRRI